MLQRDVPTQNAVSLVQQSLREAHVRTQQQLALLRLQEQALDHRALVQVRVREKNLATALPGSQRQGQYKDALYAYSSSVAGTC